MFFLCTVHYHAINWWRSPRIELGQGVYDSDNPYKSARKWEYKQVEEWMFCYATITSSLSFESDWDSNPDKVIHSNDNPRQSAYI